MKMAIQKPQRLHVIKEPDEQTYEFQMMLLISLLLHKGFWNGFNKQVPTLAECYPHSSQSCDVATP